MNLDSILDWTSSCVDIVVALALIGVGIGVVRPARPAAGWLAVAAGAVSLLSTCCFEAMNQAAEHGSSSASPEVMGWVSRALGFVYVVAYYGLLLGAAASLGPRPTQSPADYRPPV